MDKNPHSNQSASSNGSKNGQKNQSSHTSSYLEELPSKSQNPDEAANQLGKEDSNSISNRPASNPITTEGSSEQRRFVEPTSDDVPGIDTMGPADSQLGISLRSVQGGSSTKNISEIARMVSTFIGGLGVAFGVRRITTVKGWLAGLVGASLLNRGISGHCAIFEALDVDSTSEGKANHKGLMDPHPFQLKKSITLWSSRQNVYSLLLDINQYKKIVPDIQNIQQSLEGDYRLHFVGKDKHDFQIGLVIGDKVENESIAWVLAPRGYMFIKGKILLKDAPKKNATELTLDLELTPPAGAIGSAIMKFFGPIDQQIVGYLMYRMKQLVETGEIATIEEQSSGRKSDILYDIPLRTIDVVEKLREKSQQIPPERKEAS